MSIFEKESSNFQNRNYREHLNRNWDNGNKQFDAMNARINAKSEKSAPDEVVQARIDANGQKYASLAGRLDANQKMAENARDAVEDIDYRMKTAIEDKIAQMDNSVHAYPNADAIKQAYPNGKLGIFVAVDTGHQWYYVNGQWADGGAYQSDGIAPALQADIDSAVIGNGLYKNYNDVPENLRLFDTVPNNTVLAFDFDVSQYPDMHAPANSGKGVLVTLSHSDHKHVTSGGKFQLFHSRNSQMWSRVCWTSDNTFAPWVSLNRQDTAIEQPIDEQFAQNHPVYADLNTVPSGTYTYYGTSYVANAPKFKIHNDSYGFTVSTFETGFSLVPSTNKNKAGRVQLLTTFDGLIFSRISWGNTVSYSEWDNLNNKVAWGVWYNSETDEIEHDFYNNFKGDYDLKNASGLQHQSVVTYPKDGPKNGTGQGTYVTYNGVNGLGGKAQFAFKSNGELYYRVFWGNPVSEDKSWSKVKIDEPVTPPYLSLFEKVAVIGDSYASGEIYDKDGRNQNGDQYNHSWLAILSRKYGFNYYNYSRGGQTAHGWMNETSRAHGEFTTDNKHYDFYFLNLGINDHDRNPADYAGVKADIASGTNSFYGEYGRIIETIKAKDPNAPIAIATITTSFGDGNHKRYNDVIRDLASDYNLILIDFGDNITIDNIKSITKRGGHPTAVGYAKLAQAFDDCLNNAVTKQEADISNLKELFSD